MMIGKTWRVLLLVAFALLVLCAVRTLRRPAASEGAQKMEVSADCLPANEAVAHVDMVAVEATTEWQLRQREAAGAAQRIEQQEAAAELQRRQEATRPPAENPGVSTEAAGS